MIDKAREGARRRAPRLALQIPGSLSGRRPRPVTVLDLSRTGCLVRCEALLDQGAILDLEVALEPDPMATKVRVTDAYLDGATVPGEKARYLAGLEFLGLAAREASRLHRFLEDERRRRNADPPAH